MLLFSSVLLACAGQPETPDSLADEPRSRATDCIFEGTIRDYQVLDESNLIVTASQKKKYHIELGRPAFGLGSTWGIGFSSATNRICAGFSSIVVEGSFEPESVRIYGIRQLDEFEYENLLVQFGKKEPEQSKIPPAEDVAGAEIEELD
jgi:hypothetical protein